MKPGILLLSFIVGLFNVVFLFVPTEAHYVFSDIDTFEVIDVWGTAGDTVELPICFVNAVNVACINFRVEFDSLCLSPIEIETDETRLNGLGWLIQTNIETGAVSFAGATLTNKFLPLGFGPIASISFLVNPAFPLGDILIRFEDDIDNLFTDSAVQGEFIPIQVNNYVRVWPDGNRPPVIDPISGGNQRSVLVGDSLLFRVSGSDPDGDQVSLFATLLPPNATFPPANGDSSVMGTFSFEPDSTQEDDVYEVIFTLPDGLGLTDDDTVLITVLEGYNHPPVFFPGNLDTTVEEGITLELVVSAGDPEGRGPVDLFLFHPLPESADFSYDFVDHGDDHGTFTLVPGYSLGDTIIAPVFGALDQDGGFDTLSVDVEIVNEYDLLVVDNRGGAVPGGNFGRIPIRLVSEENVYGLQFDLEYSPAALSIDSIVVLSPRLADMDVFDNMGSVPGELTTTIMGDALQTIPAGTDIILEFASTVLPDAPSGRSGLMLSDALKVVDSLGTTGELRIQNGYFTVDLFGDPTLNGSVDVGDAIALVAYILNRIELSLRQWMAANINMDDNVNVGDIVSVINTILGCPPGCDGPMAGGELPTEEVFVLVDSSSGAQGSLGNPVFIEIDNQTSLTTPIAGLQIVLSYDPDKLTATEAFICSSRGSTMDVDFSTTPGQMTIVTFGVNHDTIPSGVGPVLEVLFKVRDTATGSDTLNLEKVHLYDKCGFAIPASTVDGVFTITPGVGASEDRPSPPVAFSLSPNYPNPFNPTTKFEYALPVDCQVTMEIYNLLGQRVVTLVDGLQKAGHKVVHWEAGNCASGIYFCRLMAGEYTETRRMALIR